MSVENTIGFGNSNRASSRVLKPPGGGHTDFFQPAEEKKPHARPKYDQQNSSNLNFCMNTVDPNEKVVPPVIPAEVHETEVPAQASNGSADASAPVEHHDGAAEAAANANLPKYHHHRSTALW